MSVLTVYNALQAMHATITGVVKAPTAMPASLNTADMPIVITQPAGGTFSQPASGLTKHDMEWVTWLFVKPIARGEGIDEGFQEALPFYDRFGAKYLACLNTGGAMAGIVEQLYDIRHIEPPDGTVLTFAGIACRGIEFRYRTVEKPI